ncbi:MAG: thioredoxin family protein [Pseudomonadales bacterium]|nr:thioredoxin family protein [Pseudomonadales bacterium]
MRTKVIRRKALLCLLLLLASAVAAGGKGGSSLGASLEQGIERAIELARTQDKLVFLKFGADWCPPCVRMEREAFSSLPTPSRSPSKSRTSRNRRACSRTTTFEFCPR